MDVVVVKDVLNQFVSFGSRLTFGLRVIALAFALSSCGGESSQYQPSDVADNGGPGPIAPTQGDGNSDSGDDDGNDPDPTDPSNNPTIVDLDGIPDVSTGGRQGSDPGVTVNLFGNVEAKGTSTITHTLWQQKSGPDVIITNPSRLNTQIITPVVAEETQLVFQLIAQDSEGRVNSSTTAITVQPVTTGAVVEGGVIDEGSENAEFKFELLEPVATDTLVKYKTLDGTAEAGMDYTAMEGTILVPAGQSKVSLNVPLLSGDINADAELFYLWITVPDPDGSYTVSGTVVIKSMEPVEDLPTPELLDLGPVVFTAGQAITQEVFQNNGGEQILKCSANPFLPNGLFVSVANQGASCEISGTPITISESNEYVITATNPSGVSLSNVTITVDEEVPFVEPEPTLDIPALQNITETISLTLNVPIEPIIFNNSGGEEIIECTARAGFLPAGLNALSVGDPKTSCQITGTPSEISDETEYGINATNASGTQTATINIAVQEQAAGEAPSLVNIADTKTFTAGTVIDDIEFSNVGGFGLIDCSASGIDLPAGLTFSTTDDKETCKLFGMPTTPSSVFEYAVQAKNNVGSSIATLSIEVLGIEPVLDAPGLISPTDKSFVVGSEIAPIVFENGGGKSLNSCDPQDSSFPNGLSVERFNGSDSCQIIGTPTDVVELTEFAIEATNATSTQIITINIEITEPIIQETAPDLIDISAVQTLSVNAEITPIEFENLGNRVLTNCTVLGTPLPTGLETNRNSLDTTCVISGIPTVISAQTEYTIVASSETKMDAATVVISIEDEPSALDIPILSDLPEQTFIVGDTVNAIEFENNGGAGITRCVSSGELLPSGLEFRPFGSTSCQLVGTADEAALRTEYEVTATNPTGSSIASVFITINEGLRAPLLIPAGDNTLTINDDDIEPIVILNDGGKELIDCEITPLPPTGLDIRVSEFSEHCEAFGKAENEQDLTTYTVTAFNNAGQSSTEIGIEIKKPLSLPTLGDLADQIFTVGETITPINFINSGGEEISDCSSANETPLPSGLSFVKIGSTTCQLTGTPAIAASLFEYILEVSNATGTSTASVNITVVPAVIPVVAPIIVPSVAGNQIYFTDVSITPITFSNAGDAIVSCSTNIAMPIGISFNTKTCEISGTPSANRGAVIYTITATNEGGTGMAQVSLEVRLSVEAPDLAFAAGVTNNQNFVEGEAITPISFTNNGSEFDDCSASPALPTGLFVNNETCTISGLPTVSNALTTYTLSASNAGGNDEIQISFSVEEALKAPSITLASTNNQTFTEGETIAPIVFANIGGEIDSCESNLTLPAGLTLNTKTCSISGTPTETKAQTLYILTATNTAGTNSAQVTFEVEAALQAPNLIIVSAPNQTYTEGEDISFLFMSIAGEIDECESGAVPLPAGISVNEKTCNVSGTVTAVQDSVTYSVVAKNAAGSSEKEFTFSVEAALKAPDLVLEVDNDQTFTEGEIITPITFINNGGEIDSCSSNVTMPAGLSLDTKTCEISGTPTGPRIKITYTINVSNAAGTTSVQVTFDVEAALEAPKLIGVGTVEDPLIFGVDKEITPITLGNDGGGSVTCSGELDPGMVLTTSTDNSTCIISGTPTLANNAPIYTVTATNSAGESSAYVIIEVIDYPALIGLEETLIEGKEVTNLEVINAGGFALTDCETTPSLPGGLIIQPDDDQENCVITGTPTEAIENTLYEVKATNIAGEDINDITLTILNSIDLYPLEEDTFVVGVEITPQVLAISNDGDMTSCGTQNPLPQGLSYEVVNDNTCMLSGTPEKAILGNDRYFAYNGVKTLQFTLNFEIVEAPETVELSYELLTDADLSLGVEVSEGSVTIDWNNGDTPETFTGFINRPPVLDDTGTVTLTFSNGLKSVSSLAIVDNFNFDLEVIEEMTNLKSFTSSRTQLGGNLSSFSAMEQLEILELDGATRSSESGSIGGQLESLPRSLITLYLDDIPGISGDLIDLGPNLESLNLTDMDVGGDISDWASFNNVLKQIFVDNTFSSSLENPITGDISGIPNSTTSLYLSGEVYGTANGHALSGNIQNFSENIVSITLRDNNLLSGNISDLPGSITSLSIDGLNSITGDIATLPENILRIDIEGNNTIYGDIANIHELLTSIDIDGNNNIDGDIQNLRPTLTRLHIEGENTLFGNIDNLHGNFSSFWVEGENTISGDLGGLQDNDSPFFLIGGSNTITFTGSLSTWAPATGRIYINLFGDGDGMTTNQTDNFIAYLADVAPQDNAGNTLILNRSGDEGRTSASDGPFAYLESIGFSITVKLDDYFAGEAVYELNCESCHGALEISSKRNRTQSQIEAAINSIAAMRSIVLTSEEYRVLDYALNNDSP